MISWKRSARCLLTVSHDPSIRPRLYLIVASSLLPSSSSLNSSSFPSSPSASSSPSSSSSLSSLLPPSVHMVSVLSVSTSWEQLSLCLIGWSRRLAAMRANSTPHVQCMQWTDVLASYPYLNPTPYSMGVSGCHVFDLIRGLRESLFPLASDKRSFSGTEGILNLSDGLDSKDWLLVAGVKLR